MPAQRAQRSFDCFGGRVSVVVQGTSTEGRVAALAALLAQAQLHDVHRRLSPSVTGSELARLNDDPADVVAASRLLRRLAHAVVADGERSGFADGIVVDDLARTIARPAGLRIDAGGLVAALGADLLALTLAGHPAFAIDCAGDVRIGGRSGAPHTVLVDDPFAPGASPVQALRIAAGAAATRARPAATGVVQATALAATALEAALLARTALLGGSERGRDALEHGGVLVLAGGRVEVVAPASPPLLADRMTAPVRSGRAARGQPAQTLAGRAARRA